MGLDITAWDYVREGGDAEKRWWESFKTYEQKGFPERLAPLKPNTNYQGWVSLKFRAGSYGGYNDWREQLAQLAGYASARHVWNDHLLGPFVELINFSDCEGVIGSEAAQKLATDFAAFNEKALKHKDPWFYRMYRRWWMAFEIASDGGAVEFH